MVRPGLLALLFLFTGGIKLVLPLEMLTGQTPLPGLFVRFLGVAEVLGANGLILPGLLGTRRVLTPLAACGLVTAMIGATVLTAAGVVSGGGVTGALSPLVVGLLSAFVAYGRLWLAPLGRGSTKYLQGAFPGPKKRVLSPRQVLEPGVEPPADICGRDDAANAGGLS